MTELFIALDGLFDEEEKTLAIAKRLIAEENDVYVGFKLNCDYILRCGISRALERIIPLQCPIFVDLKMWNGGRTMARAIEHIAAYGARYITVYALAEKELRDAADVLCGFPNTRLLAVTVPSHYDAAAYCQKHFGKSLRDSVRHFTDTAIGAGCAGVVVPGTTLSAVRFKQCRKASAGIRPAWYEDCRHSEYVTPAAAVLAGADILVCGRPVMNAYDPTAALKKIVCEIEAAGGEVGFL